MKETISILKLFLFYIQPFQKQNSISYFSVFIHVDLRSWNSNSIYTSRNLLQVDFKNYTLLLQSV